VERMSGRASGSDLVVGSWRRTAAIAVVIVAVAGVAVAYFGGFGPLRQANYPGHPYPPPGYTANPFGGPGDLISASDAQRVKEDLLNDGALEVQAFQRGDSSLLAQSDTGNSLARLQVLVQQDAAAGVVRRYDNQVQRVVVGQTPDRASPSVTWAVEEMGQATLTTIRKSNGQAVDTQHYRFDGKFWLVKVGDRYLITDAEVTNQPIG
jgi:hypothetical protein